MTHTAPKIDVETEESAVLNETGNLQRRVSHGVSVDDIPYTPMTVTFRTGPRPEGY